ncbi:eef1aknmt [Symbiodinium natans]|uniref:Eef1aknmt protein n=1 Tax=Symbiodinium natans TaxID=878477 RepID=A0A812MZT3_9DINO|nr:eef1aknmt [Symbiodinium natans]
MDIPSYSKQEYWEQRYRTEPEGAPEWYVDWPHLKRHLCDQNGILGPLALVPPALVLELGCGNFSLVPGLTSSGFAALGVDFSPTATEAAAQAASPSAPADFATLDARALPLRPGSFDAVLDKGCFDALKADDSRDMLAEACRLLTAGGRFLCVSNNEMLVRSHARKVSGWKSAFGSPFCIPDLDDELYLHCYIRDAPDICLHDAPKGDLILAKERMEGQSKSGQDSGPSKTYVAHEQLVPSKLHKLTLSVPWALHASDIALHVADEGADCDEQHVVVAPDGADWEDLVPVPWHPGQATASVPETGLRLRLPRDVRTARTAARKDGDMQQEAAPTSSFSARSKTLTLRLRPSNMGQKGQA